MKKKLSIYILIFMSLLSVIFADSNGIWHLAEDLRGGIIGEDEQMNNPGYTFFDAVYVNASFKVNGHDVATLDSTGTVPLNQLPFNKGDLVAPASRPLLAGAASYKTHYFDITNLAISGNIANNVVEGVSFGPNNEFRGGLSKSNICSAAGGTANCGVTAALPPGDFYTIVGTNNPSTINYCNKISVFSDGTISSTSVRSAGICEYISKCDSTAQTKVKYSDNTVCGSNKICKSGSCITKVTPNDYLRDHALNYGAAGGHWTVPKPPAGLTPGKAYGYIIVTSGKQQGYRKTYKGVTFNSRGYNCYVVATGTPQFFTLDGAVRGSEHFASMSYQDTFVYSPGMSIAGSTWGARTPGKGCWRLYIFEYDHLKSIMDELKAQTGKPFYTFKP